MDDQFLHRQAPKLIVGCAVHTKLDYDEVCMDLSPNVAHSHIHKRSQEPVVQERRTITLRVTPGVVSRILRRGR